MRKNRPVASPSVVRTRLLRAAAASLAIALCAVAPARAGVPTSSLTFANPTVAGPASNRDLGDAADGSQPVRRLRALGGVPPYAFTATSLPSALQLRSDGLLTSPSGVSGATLLTFDATVADSAYPTPSTLTATFRLDVVSSSQFRFASSAMPEARMYRPYDEVLPLLNEAGPVTFAASNVTVNATPVTSLASVGLSLSPDGHVFGVPVPFPATNGAQTITFTATATDSATATAAGRDGNGASQSFAIAVGPNVAFTSGLAGSSVKIKAGTGQTKDSLAFKGSIGLGSTTLSALNGRQAIVRVGRYVSPPVTLDAKGRATSKGASATVAFSVTAAGKFSVAISRATIDVGVPAGATGDLPVEVDLGGLVAGQQVLRCAVKRGKSTVVTLASNADVSGGAQLLKVQGADSGTGDGDAWKLSFLATPPADMSLAGVTAVSVSIGNANQSVAQLLLKGTAFGALGDASVPASVALFGFDPSTGKGGFTTGAFTSAATGLSVALGASSPESFRTRITLLAGQTAVFAVEGSLKIYPTSKGWTSVAPVGGPGDVMTASIDGTAFAATSFSADVVVSAGVLDVIGSSTDKSAQPFKRIEFVGNGAPINGTGTFSVQCTYDVGATGRTYAHHLTLGGELIVTTYDLAGKHVEGTFSFTTNEQNPADDIHVTGGHFDIRHVRVQ